MKNFYTNTFRIFIFIWIMLFVRRITTDNPNMPQHQHDIGIQGQNTAGGIPKHQHNPQFNPSGTNQKAGTDQINRQQNYQNYKDDKNIDDKVIETMENPINEDIREHINVRPDQHMPYHQHSNVINRGGQRDQGINRETQDTYQINQNKEAQINQDIQKGINIRPDQHIDNTNRGNIPPYDKYIQDYQDATSASIQGGYPDQNIYGGQQQFRDTQQNLSPEQQRQQQINRNQYENAQYRQQQQPSEYEINQQNINRQNIDYQQQQNIQDRKNYQQYQYNDQQRQQSFDKNQEWRHRLAQIDYANPKFVEYLIGGANTGPRLKPYDAPDKSGDKLIGFGRKWKQGDLNEINLDQAFDYLREDVQSALENVRKVIPDADFNKLSEWGKELLTDISYHLGPQFREKVPKFVQGILRNDMDMIKREYERFKKQNDSLLQKLFGKNQRFADYFNLSDKKSKKVDM